MCHYVDLINIEIPVEFAMGQTDAKTSAACHGAAFFADFVCRVLARYKRGNHTEDFVGNEPSGWAH